MSSFLAPYLAFISHGDKFHCDFPEGDKLFAVASSVFAVGWSNESQLVQGVVGAQW